MSKKIIVPKGVVSPDLTVIIDIPEELAQERELIASPIESPPSASARSRSTPCSSGECLSGRRSGQQPAISSGGSVTSTTIDIQSLDEAYGPNLPPLPICYVPPQRMSPPRIPPRPALPCGVEGHSRPTSTTQTTSYKITNKYAFKGETFEKMGDRLIRLSSTRPSGTPTRVAVCGGQCPARSGSASGRQPVTQRPPALAQASTPMPCPGAASSSHTRVPRPSAQAASGSSLCGTVCPPPAERLNALFGRKQSSPPPIPPRPRQAPAAQGVRTTSYPRQCPGSSRRPPVNEDQTDDEEPPDILNTAFRIERTPDRGRPCPGRSREPANVLNRTYTIDHRHSTRYDNQPDEEEAPDVLNTGFLATPGSNRFRFRSSPGADDAASPRSLLNQGFRVSNESFDRSQTTSPSCPAAGPVYTRLKFNKQEYKKFAEGLSGFPSPIPRQAGGYANQRDFNDTTGAVYDYQTSPEMPATSSFSQRDDLNYTDDVDFNQTSCATYGDTTPTDLNMDNTRPLMSTRGSRSTSFPTRSTGSSGRSYGCNLSSSLGILGSAYLDSKYGENRSQL